MDRPAAFVLAFELALAPAVALVMSLESLPATAQVASPPATPGRSSAPWNSSTAPQPPRQPAADGALSLRVYRDRNGNGTPPYRPGPNRPDDAAYAVDVSAVVTRCADDSLVITALVVGGQLTQLDNRCPAEPVREPAGPAPTCDATRWTCTTTGAEPTGTQPTN